MFQHVRFLGSIISVVSAVIDSITVICIVSRYSNISKKVHSAVLGNSFNSVNISVGCSIADVIILMGGKIPSPSSTIVSRSSLQVAGSKEYLFCAAH